MTIYEAFRNSCLDLSALGLQDGPSVSNSKLIPGHNRVLTWLADSPVHFCQIPEQGETVFAVDPNALPGEQVLPVAEDILSFIGLLICCKDAALIAGAYQWSNVRLQERIDAIELSMKARSVIRALENIYHPPVIRDPGATMYRLRKELAVPVQTVDWKVGFETDFSQSCPKERSGKELTLNRSVSHPQGTWYVPSAYLCEDGIVVDTFLEVAQDSLENFRNRWGCHGEKLLSLAEQYQMQLDDPLNAPVTGVLTVNDKRFGCKSSFSALWHPMRDNTAEIRSILNHYRLDPNMGYLFKRYCFLRKGKQPQIRTMELTLEATQVMVPEEAFTAQRNGMRFRFVHPGTGLEHIFTVVEQSQEALNPNFLTNHPCYYTKLIYTLEPSISPENFRIVDQEPGDPWEGYQDEPAAVIFRDRKPDPGRYALSSLHYEPREQVRWQMVFRRKLHADVQLKLLP